MASRASRTALARCSTRAGARRRARVRSPPPRPTATRSCSLRGGGLGVFGTVSAGDSEGGSAGALQRGVRGVRGAVWRRLAAGGHQHRETFRAERTRAPGSAHALRVRQHRPAGDCAGDRDRQLAWLAGGERSLPEPGGTAGAMVGADARRRAGARDPGDRGGQPRAQPEPAAGLERRERRGRRGADHGRGRSLGLPVRAPGRKPHQPDPLGWGADDPRVRDRRARLSLVDLRLVHAGPARCAVRDDRIPAGERERRRAQPRHERRADERAADPARAEPVARPGRRDAFAPQRPRAVPGSRPAADRRRSLGRGVGLQRQPQPARRRSLQPVSADAVPAVRLRQRDRTGIHLHLL